MPRRFPGQNKYTIRYSVKPFHISKGEIKRMIEKALGPVFYIHFETNDLGHPCGFGFIEFTYGDDFDKIYKGMKVEEDDVTITFE
jgi:hypothetical protein